MPLAYSPYVQYLQIKLGKANCLYLNGVNPRIRLEPIVYGGGQERNILGI